MLRSLKPARTKGALSENFNNEKVALITIFYLLHIFLIFFFL